MSNWKYILIVALVLIGGAASFGYWALSEFKVALAGLDNSYNELSSSVMALTSLHNSQLGKMATSSPQVFFNHPSKGDELTVGCLYNIDLTSSTTIQSLELTLVDAESDEPIDTKSSGLASTTDLGKLKKIPWTVGGVESGEYYLSLLKINGLKVGQKSEIFNIKESLNTASSSTSCR